MRSDDSAFGIVKPALYSGVNEGVLRYDLARNTHYTDNEEKGYKERHDHLRSKVR